MQVPTHCLLLFAIEAGDLLDLVKCIISEDCYNQGRKTVCFLCICRILIAIPENNAIKTVQQSAKDKEGICRRADARQRYLTQDFTL